ncbi:hypothetical protein D3C76_625780 [compost metagenome]
MRRDRARWRNVAGSVGQGDLQGAAVNHGRVKRDHEGAVCTDGAGRQYISGSITYLNGGTCFAAAAKLRASEADYQVGRCLRWRGITAVDIRRGDGTGCRGIARNVGCGGLQHFAIDLRRSEGDVEHASRAD